jgi:hypothetical protein
VQTHRILPMPISLLRFASALAAAEGSLVLLSMACTSAVESSACEPKGPFGRNSTVTSAGMASKGQLLHFRVFKELPQWRPAP